MSSREADRFDPSALEALATALDSLAHAARPRPVTDELERLSRIVRDYAVPRLQPDRPLDVVFAGPTGSGKSTLVNSISGLSATAAGVLRPTTTRPVILTDRDRAPGYVTLSGVGGEVVGGESPALTHMTLIDTPDLDSTSTEHRVMAERIIDSADVVVFVMSALRYADMVPWQVLRRAVARGAIVVPVLNRVTPGTIGARVDFAARLRSEGIVGQLVVIPEQRGHRGDIPRAATRPLARRLAELVEDHRLVAAQTLDRVLEHVRDRALAEVESLQGVVDDVPGPLGPQQIAAFDLSALAAAIPAVRPDGQGRRQLRHWRAQASAALDRRGLEDRVADALSAVLRSEAMLAGVERGLIDDHRAVAGELTKTWLGFVSRVCEETGRRRGTADVAYLARAAASGDPLTQDDPVFGTDLPVFVERVDRDLRSRLAMALEDARSKGALDDLGELSKALEETGKALAPLAPAPAPAHA